MEGVVESLCQVRLGVDRLAMPHDAVEFHVERLCQVIHLDEFSTFSNLIIVAFERLATAVWQHNNFSEKAAFYVSKLTLERIWQTILWEANSTKDITFPWPSCWLGGLSRDAHATRSCDRMLATGVFLASQLGREQHLNGFLSNLSKNYSNYGEVAARLLENDERCIGVLVALFDKRRYIESSSIFEARRLVLEVFRRINYDQGTLIEWLQSEPMSAVLLTRVARDMIYKDNWIIWKTISDKMERIPSVCVLDQTATWCEEQNAPQSDDIIVEIEEVIGENISSKKLRLSKKEPIRLKINPASLSTEVWAPVTEMFTRLGVRLSKLGMRYLGFNPTNMVNIIEKLDELLENIENDVNAAEKDRESSSISA